MKTILSYDRIIEETEEESMKPVVVRNVSIGDGMPKICVPIVGKTREEILMTAKEILNVPADLVEWRVDYYESVFEMQKVVALSAELREVLGDMPILFTFRTKKEGGEKELKPRVYVMLNQMMIASGNIDLVDIEVFAEEKEVMSLIETAHKYGVKAVGSNHDFAKTPDKEEIVRRLCYMQSIGVDIPKIAVMPQNQHDVLTLLSATEEMVSKYADRPIVTISMSGIGTVSRIAGEIFGSAITFGALEKTSAPGQIQAEELKNILEIMHKEL